MSRSSLKPLNFLNFLKLQEKRAHEVEFAESRSNGRKRSQRPNELASLLHPSMQHLVVNDVRIISDQVRSYTLSLDPDFAGAELNAASRKSIFSIISSRPAPEPVPAYFLAGQYLSIFLDIDGSTLTRPYSISSSPSDALKGTYTITVKRADGGFASGYIHDHWAAGTKLRASMPLGTFTHNALRDAHTVIGIAGGSGITPFYSMAQAIRDGIEDFNLILLYGSRTPEDAIYLDELKEIAGDCEKVTLVNVFSDEAPAETHSAIPKRSLSEDTKDGSTVIIPSPSDSTQTIQALAEFNCLPNTARNTKCKIFTEYGFITAELIRKYTPRGGDCSFFLCGPQAMYAFADKELEKLDIRKKFIRHELFGEYRLTDSARTENHALPGTPVPDIAINNTDITRAAAEKHTSSDNSGDKNISYNLHVRQGGQEYTVTCGQDESLLVSMERAGIPAPSRCRSGECGWCRSILIKGEIWIPEEKDNRRLADKKLHNIHPCITFPLSDIELEVPPFAH